MSSSPTSSSSSGGEVEEAYEGLLDVRVPIEVHLGTGELSVRGCLALRRNSIVSLWESAGSDLRVSANGVIVARGEVVIVEDSTAIRITEIEGRPGLETT